MPSGQNATLIIRVFVDPILRIQGVVNAPVAELLPEGRDQSEDGGPSRTNQVGDELALSSMIHSDDLALFELHRLGDRSGEADVILLGALG